MRVLPTMAKLDVRTVWGPPGEDRSGRVNLHQEEKGIHLQYSIRDILVADPQIHIFDQRFRILLFSSVTFKT
jgi:hypothetical protein